MEFRDLKEQYNALKMDIDASIREVIKSAQFISGSQVKELESMLASYVGVKHCITCGNGTDAITLALLAWHIGPGDAVFVPDFTFFSSGECPATVGATPIFVDVKSDTYNLDPDKLEQSIEKVICDGTYRPRAVVAVDLFGLPADYDAIRLICDKYGLLLLEDGAQGFGGLSGDRRACSFGDISTTSFFPTKPLGCYGDGGAIFTDNDEWADLIRSLCVHGKKGEDKYNNVRLGMNSRLDTLQAAILIPKFISFQAYELNNINCVANTYSEMLSDENITLPKIPSGFYSSWAQYTVILGDDINRDQVQKQMREEGIPTMVYYSKPMHKQEAFRNSDSSFADCPVTEMLCGHVLCLPIHPYMESADVEKVVKTLTKHVK